MKYLTLSFIALSFMVVLTPEADAAACRAGAYYSGCVSRYGTTIRRHGYRPNAGRCYWRAGRRVCY